MTASPASYPQPRPPGIGSAHPFIRPGDAWGPFAPDLDPGERLARLRVLRAVVHLLLGPRGLALQDAIRSAERHRTMGRLYEVLVEIDTLAAKDRRNVLTSYAAVTRL